MIGAGSMANRVHYPSLASFDDVEMAAICDIDTGRLHSTADNMASRGATPTISKMVEEVAPDAVYVIGQPHMMYDIWTWCLRRIEPLHRKTHGHHHPPGAIAGPSGRRAWLHHPGQLSAADPAHGHASARGVPQTWTHRARRMRLLQVRHRALPGGARPHDGRRRSRHRHAALDVRRRGGGRPQRDQARA